MSDVALRQPMTLLGELERSGALTATSLTLPGNMSGDEMEAVFAMIALARDTLQCAEVFEAEASQLPKRIATKIRFTAGCWEWVGAISKWGYGNVKDIENNCYRGAHRFVYEILRGPIPKGLVLDHLCRNTRCVRPDHLEPVTQAVNLRRGIGFVARQAEQTHCIRDHPFDDENTYLHKGHRYCKTCRRDRNRVRYHRRKSI